MAATISDVASRARVSTATVSRVLADSDRVLPETRRRVTEAIRELDYRPSAVARSLRLMTTAFVGLIVSDITNPFYPEVVRGVEDEARQQGRSVLLCNAAEDREREEDYLNLLLERRVDAVVIASSGLARRQYARLSAFAVPVVLINTVSPDDRLPAIVSDNRSGGRLAGEHLVEQGYERVVHIAGPSDSGKATDRQLGVAEAAGDADLLAEPGGEDLEGGANAMREIASGLQPPFGVSAHNDLTAIGALSVLRELGWEVPGEVGVVGFDDVALSAYVTPSLTTIAQEKYAMGVAAARTVDRLLAGESVVGTRLLPVELVERSSTAPRTP